MTSLATPTTGEEQATQGVGARVGGYYYAHGAVATDPNFSRPQRISSEEVAALDKEVDENTSVSKWNHKNYHWEEQDRTDWVKTRLNELLGSITVNIGKKGSVCVSNVAVEGFMCVNVRKGKLIPLFELTLNVHWTGRMEDARNGPTIVTGMMPTRELNFEDAPAVKEGEKQVESILEDRWLVKKSVCNLSEEDNVVGVVKDQTSVDRMIRHQTILNKTFTKKILPMLRSRLSEFLVEVSA